MRFIVFLFLLYFGATISLANCEDTLFSFDVAQKNSNVRIIDIVENMAETCRFSVRVKDKEAKRVLETPLYLVHIKDYTLENMFDFLFTQQNMFYRYDEVKKVLTLSYLETRSFTVDYVNFSELTTDSTKTISVGVAATGGSNSNYNNSSNSSSGYSSGSSSSSANNSSNSDLTRVVSKSQFQFWEKLSSEIDAILSRDEDAMQIKSKSIINREAGIITITGTKDQIQRISSYLDKVKGRLHKQVMLETKLVELRYADIKDRGIDWSKLELSIKGDTSSLLTDKLSDSSYTFSVDLSMDGLFKFLNKYGSVDVMSTPKVLTLNNQPAVINVGDQINYRYQTGSQTSTTTGASTTNTYYLGSVFIGLTLNIVPEITDDGYIILRVNPVVSEETRETNDVKDEHDVRIMPPDIKIKQLSSLVKVKNGEKIIIGGLISKAELKTDNKVPLLHAIPILGYAFKYEGKKIIKTELIVVITPTIITDDNFPTLENVESALSGKLNE